MNGQKEFQMNFQKIGFIGLGLIGGSIAKTIKRIYPETTVLAAAGHTSTISEAYEDGTIVNSSLPDFSSFSDCDIIFLCCPVKKNIEYLKILAPIIGETCILTDVGSVKTDIHEEVAKLGLEEHFIGGHPMTGSEKTGYANATPYLLENAYYILTPSEQIHPNVLLRFQAYISSLGALTMILDYKEHDHATAAISHLPHIIAASLVNLIADIDNEEEVMKTIAAGGFRDITRIASSSPVMWQNICLSNSRQITELIDLFIKRLTNAKTVIEQNEADAIYRFFETAKEYRDSIHVAQCGSISKVYDIYCDLRDEAGSIATIATILAVNGLSIKNIGILHNREFQQGVLHIELYDENSLKKSIALLKKYDYTIYTR